MSIHPTAIVHPGAELGADVVVGPYSVIENHVRIGKGTVIGPHVTLLSYTTVGDDCRLHANAVLGDFPQDVAFTNDESYVRIGAKCLIREGVTIHRGTKPGTATEVGNGCFLMVNSHLGHNVKLGDGVVLANGALLAGYVEVGERAFISGNCLVHQFTRVGRLAMLGGASAASKDVPPFFTLRPMAGNVVVGLNTVGLRRAGIGAEDRLALRKAFHLLYTSGLNIPEAVAHIKRELTAGPVQELCAFIEASKRGICKLDPAAADEPADED